ncbi:MAG: PIN domain-containing protein [Candidatus Kapabacteria bacterium]|nr:PIN domain-containing protein [Ignavibacteriota bacterium]MCW5884300.1 PIN domain-containing protein [Candidatus Kapabacteria bacterium]
MRYLLDTNICIYFLKGQFNLIDTFASKGLDKFAISEITYAELVYGAEKSQNIEKNLLVVENFIKSIPILPIFPGLKIYAKEKARLRNLGLPISDFDVLIASTAIYNDMVLITRNIKEFERIQNLKYENWIDEN